MKKVIVLCLSLCFVVACTGKRARKDLLSERPLAPQDPTSSKHPICDEVLDKEFLTSFAKDVCSLDGSTMSKWTQKELNSCNEKFLKMVYARFAMEYEEADPDYIRNWCDAYPSECKDLRKVEMKVSESHRIEKSNRIYRQRVEQVRAAQIEDAERRKRFGEAMLEVSRQLKNDRPVNCYSSPNGIGGFNTTCHPQ